MRATWCMRENGKPRRHVAALGRERYGRHGRRVPPLKHQAKACGVAALLA